jgi:hypothetical protein
VSERKENESQGYNGLARICDDRDYKTTTSATIYATTRDYRFERTARDDEERTKCDARTASRFSFLELDTEAKMRGEYFSVFFYATCTGYIGFRNIIYRIAIKRDRIIKNK